MACFSSTCDATSYIYASEIFPTPARARGLATSISGLFIATIIFLQCAPTAFDAIGWRYYIVFIACTSAALVFVLFCCPETRRKSLEDVADLFEPNPDEKALGDNTERSIDAKGVVSDIESSPTQGLNGF